MKQPFPERVKLGNLSRCRERVLDTSVVLVLAAITMIVYGQTRSFEFVFDDEMAIVNNPYLAQGLTAEGIRWAFTSLYFANWYPATWISHMADIQFFGLNPGSHHLMNVLYHATASGILYFVLRTMTGALWRSAIVAAIFAVHPIHVESVAWVTERKDALSTVFLVLGVGAHVHYARRPGAARLVTVTACFALGLMCKPMVVTFPFLLLLVDWWPLNRLAPFVRHGRSFVHLVAEKSLLFALVVVSSAITYLAQDLPGAVQSLDLFPMKMRVANALESYLTYIAKLIYPTHLTVYYPYPDAAPAFWKLLGAAAVLGGLTLIFVRFSREKPFLLVGWFWFVGTLVPVIGIVQVGSQAMADRYAYLPSIGFSIAVVWWFDDLTRNRHRHLFTVSTLSGRAVPPSPHPSPGGRGQGAGEAVKPLLRQTILPVASSGVIALLMIGARHQVAYWRDGVTLYARAVEVTQGNWLMFNNLGKALERTGDLVGAERAYREAIRIRPRYDSPYHHLVRLLLRLGRRSEAIALSQIFLRMNPSADAAHITLAEALLADGNPAGAEDHLRTALRVNPATIAGRLTLARLLSGSGRPREAIGLLREAMERNPDDAAVHRDLANLLAQSGKPDEAIGHYREALRLAPNWASTHFNYGVTLEIYGWTSEAEDQYQQALRLDPGYARARLALERLQGRLR